jgi:hypothetical protein
VRLAMLMLGSRERLVSERESASVGRVQVWRYLEAGVKIRLVK